MMTEVEPETPFSGVSDEIRSRLQPDESQLKTATEGADGTVLSVDSDEPSHCLLHFLDPAHYVLPSFATVIGMSLCAACTIGVSEGVVAHGYSAKEFMAEAITGEWIL